MAFLVNNTHGTLAPTPPPDFYTKYVGRGIVVGNFTLVGDTDALALESTQELMDPLKLLDADVVVFSGIEGFAASLYSQVFEDAGFRPAGVYGIKGIDFSEEPFIKGPPNGWTFSASFHPDLGLGSSGIRLGTTAEYVETYLQIIGQPFNVSYAASASGILTAWEQAVVYAGAEWKDKDHFRAGMLSLNASNSDETTFYGNWQFTTLGENIGKQPLVVQYQDNQLQLIRSSDQLQYPISWPSDSSSSLGVGAEIGIAIGALAGCVLLLICIGGVTALIAVIAWKKWFHVIVLKKGKGISEV